MNKASVWDGECEEAIGKLKKICTSAPILVYADFLKPFELCTKMCSLGLGAILYQNQDGVGHIIAYVSSSLSKTEHKYWANKLEFLALKLAILEKFHRYLYGNTFVIYMANNLLTYVLTSAKLDATCHHWVATLVYYNLTLSYQSGKANVDVDALSCISREEHNLYIEDDSICALISQAAQVTTLIETYT